MMRKLMTFAWLLAVVACQQSNPDAEKKAAREQINVLQERTKVATTYDQELADSLTMAYLDFVESYPQDSLSAVYLSRAADLYKEQKGEAPKAIEIYQRIRKQYPESPLAVRSEFMIAYVYDARIKNEEKAIAAYQQFLKNHPEHQLAKEARNLLVLLQDTLSEEELVKQWMKQEKTKNTP